MKTFTSNILILNMKISNLYFLLLISILAVSSCSKDDDDTPTIESCQLLGVLSRLDATTNLGLFSVEYSSNGRVMTAGLQTYDMVYDADGNVLTATLEETSFNPRVQFEFTYDNDEITQIRSLWGDAANPEERYVYTPVYSGGFVDKVMRTGLGGDVELDYEFDSNGNALKWTDPIFDDYKEFTFDTSQKGIIEGITHNQAFAYGIAINQPFFHVVNALTSEKEYGSDGTLTDESTFSDNEFNELGLQTSANDPDNKQYIFEYLCE